MDTHQPFSIESDLYLSESERNNSQTNEISEGEIHPPAVHLTGGAEDNDGEPSETDDLYAVTPRRAATADHMATKPGNRPILYLRGATSDGTRTRPLPPPPNSENSRGARRRADDEEDDEEVGEDVEREQGRRHTAGATGGGRPVARRRTKANLPNATGKGDVHTPVTPQMYRDGRAAARRVTHTPVRDFSVPSVSLSALIDTDEDEDDEPVDNVRVDKKAAVDDELPAIIHLNVGGHRFMTRLSTLRKDPGCMLAAMFSGRHKLDKDKSGYYFIDSNGLHFEYILNYLRNDTLPPSDLALAVYHEAGYFNIGGLVDRLKTSPAVARFLVHESHRLQFPDYYGLKQKIINVAIEMAAVDRMGEVIIYAFRKEFTPRVTYFNINHECVVDTAHICVGPWDSLPDEEALIKCLETDFTNDGFQIKPHEQKRRCKYYNGQNCQKCVFKITFIFL